MFELSEQIAGYARLNKSIVDINSMPCSRLMSALLLLVNILTVGIYA